MSLRASLEESGFDPEDIKKIIAAIKKYWDMLAELQCILLEFAPGAKISVSYTVSEACTLVYTVSKQ